MKKYEKRMNRLAELKEEKRQAEYNSDATSDNPTYESRMERLKELKQQKIERAQSNRESAIALGTANFSKNTINSKRSKAMDYALEKARNTVNTTTKAMSRNGSALQGALDIAKRERENKKKLEGYEPVYGSFDSPTTTRNIGKDTKLAGYRNRTTGETMTVEDYENTKAASNTTGKQGAAVSSFKGAKKRAIEEALQQQADTSWMPEKEPETAKEYADYIDKYYQSLSDPELASLSDEELSAKITSAKDEKEGNKDKLKNYEPVYGSFDSPVLARNITKDTKLAGYKNRLTGETMSAEEHDALEGNTAIDKYENEQSVRKNQKAIKKWSEDYAKLTPEQEQAVMQMYITDHDEEEATEQEQAIRDTIGSRDPFELEKAYNSAKENLESQGINADDMEEYYSWIHNRQIDTKKRRELEEETKQEGLKGFLINAKESATSVGDSLLSGADFVDQLGHSAKNYFGGDEAYTPYDPYSARFTQSRNRRREAVSNDIDSTIGKFVYDVGMSMADSAAAMATGSEPVSLGIMAASAGSQAYVDASERGVDTNKAAAIGIANAAAEAGFEKLSLDHLYGMAENPTKTTFKKKILDWAAQSGIEGSEEVFTDFADEAADRMINGGLSEYSTNVKEYMKNGMSEDEAKTAANEQFWNQVGQDFVAGAISGAVFGGVVNTVNSVQYHKMGKTINQDNTMRDTILETAEQMPENSTAKQIADTVKTDNITDSQMSQIIESMAKSEDVNLDKVITEGFVRKGAEQEQAQQQAQKLMNDAADITTTKEENTIENTTNNVADRMVNAEGITAENQKVAPVQQYSRNQTGVTEAVNKNTGKQNIVVEIAESTPEKTMVKLSDGSIVDYKTVEINNPTMRNLYNFAATFDDTKAANAVIENYNGESMPTYLESAAVFYNAGKLGKTSYESIMNNPVNARIVSEMSPSTLLEMYYLGENSRNPVVQNSDMQQAVKMGSGSVIDNRLDKSDNRMKSVAELVAKKTGLDIELNDELSHGENGNFQKALSRIALAKKTGKGTDTNEYTTLVHELGEFSEAYNHEGMQKVVDTVLDYVTTKEGAAYLTNTIEQYHKAYKTVEKGKTYEDSANEYVFDYVAGLFTDKDGVEAFSKYMSENMTESEHKSILKTIADFFKGVYDKITSYLNEHVLSSTAKKALRADAEEAQRIRDMFLGELTKAQENYKRENVTAEEGEHYTIKVIPAEKYMELGGPETLDIDSEKTFSLDVNMEEGKDLIAVHNLKEDNLNKALELGGFPMPSIAITKKQIGHSGYGDISVLFKKETVDPKNKDNRVFGADAYTARFPRVDYKVNEEELSKLAERIGTSANYIDANAFNGNDLKTAAMKLSEMIEVKERFIRENNLKVEPVLRMPTAEPSFMGRGAVKEYLNNENITVDKLVYDKKVREGLLDTIREKTSLKALGEKWATKINDNLSDMESDKEIYNILKEQYQTYIDIAQGKAKPIEDRYSYTDGVNNTIRDNQDAFELYTLELAEPVIGKAGIYNGKEYYTASGNLRSFEALHDDYNIENIVKAMKSAGVKNEEGSLIPGIGEVRAAVSKDFKSIEDIKKQEGRLLDLTPEQVDEIYSESRELYQKIVSEIVDNNKTISDNSFFDRDIAGRNIIEAVKGGLKPEKIQKSMQKYYKNISSNIANDIVRLGTILKDIPVKYFEGKPQRAVGFDEVAAVVIPDSISEKTKDKLKQAGIKAYEYKTDNEASRKEVVNRAAVEQDTVFSIDVDAILKNSKEVYISKREYAILASEVEKNNYSKDFISRKINPAFSDKYFYLYKVTDKNANKFKVLAQYDVELYHDDIEEVMKSGRFKKNYRTNEGFDKGIGFLWGRYKYNSGSSQRIENGRRSGRTDSVRIRDTERSISEQYIGSRRADNGKSITDNPEKRYSIDSEGRKLSEEQKKYFENSTVRDDNGNLLPMYHGTPNGDFTVFKNDIQFFTPNRWYADFYQEPSASSRKAGKTVTNKKTYEVYLNITKPFDIRNPETKEIFINDYVKGGYALGINPYEEYKDTTNSGLPSWEEADNIYEFLEDNDLLDEYDGIIVDEGGFPGEDGKIVQRGISYVTFNQNQIKNVDNKKPTADPDIRHSVDIDEDLMAILEEEYSDTEKEMGSIIEDGFKALENVSIDDKTMRKIASEVKQEYKSTYNAKELADNLTKVFAYLKDTKNVSYEDMVRIVQEIAMPVIEESTDVDSVEADVYNSFRKTLKGQKIRLNEAQKKEVAHYYDSYDKFRKMNFGNITFSEDGMYLDSLWDELCQSSNYILDMDTAVNDQPIALIDAMNEMKPAKHNIFGMNKQQAAYDLALDIYRRFFVEQSTDTANKKVLAETQKLIVKQQEYRKNLNAEYRERFEKLKEQEKTRRDSLKQKYERALDEQRRELSSAMAYRDAKAETEIRKKIKSYEAKLAKVKQQSNDKYMKLKAAQSENRTAKRNIEERRRYRERIRKNAQGIVTAFNQNTDKNHVPDALKKMVVDFIDAIDFTTDRTNPNSVDSLKWYNALSQMQLKLSSEREAIAGDYEDIYNALMDGNSGDRKTSSLLDDISDFLNNNEGVRISDMDMNGLRYLDRLVSGLKRAITSVNQLYVNERTQNVEELGDNTIEELKSKKDKKVWNNDTLRGKAINKAENMLDANMLDPRSYFYRLGDSALSIYNGLRKGLNNRIIKIAEAQDYMQSQFGKIAEECGLTEKQLKSEMKKWTGRDAEVHEFDFGNKKLRMTTAQMMGLYELKNRDQAKEHIKYGGVITTTKAGTKVYRNSEGIRLTEYEVGKICEELTPEQKKVADSMQQFMQNRCSAWGNATTMQMYGYRRFGGQHYYPIKTSGNTVDTKDQTSYWGVKNQGFTKKTMKNARNAIVVDDIFDVFTKHVTDMASYGSYTAALSDAMKWFNYRQKAGLDDHMTEDEVLDILESKTSVKAQIERAYGKEYQEYFKKLVQDINAEGTGDVQVKFIDGLVGNMKAASVAANIRVAIQQPTAYFRAMAVMDTKYLMKAFTKLPKVREVQEKVPIAKWKSWGYFETSIGQSMKEVITAQHTVKEGLQDISMKVAQKLDDTTWGVLWNAVKLETKALHPDVDISSDEFTELCVDRYDELIDQTQVVDSVLHRSQIMRSNNGLHKMATSFMAEPTKSYNMLANAIRDWYEMPGKWNAGSKRFFKQTLKAYIITNVVNAAAQSFVDALRDKKDDDTTYWERWLADYKDNVIDNLNPVQLIPYIKDVLSVVQGYDINRLDMQGLSKLYAGAVSIQKYATDADYREKHTWLEAAEPFVNGVSLITGIPIYNVERDFKALYNNITGKYLGGIKRTDSRQYERMLNAYLSGDKELYKEVEGELKEKGLEKKEITSKVKKEIKDGYLAGDISEKEAKKFLKEKAGQSDEEIWCTLEEWNYGETYQRLYDAIDNSINKGAARDAIFDYISEAKSKGGKENKDISGVVTREYKKKYLKAKEKGKYADMKNLLISIYMHLGYTNAEANKKIEEWSKKKTK